MALPGGSTRTSPSQAATTIFIDDGTARPRRPDDGSRATRTVLEGRRFIEFVMKRGRNLVTTQGIVYRMAALAPGWDRRPTLVLLGRLHPAGCASAEKGDVRPARRDPGSGFEGTRTSIRCEGWKLSEAARAAGVGDATTVTWRSCGGALPHDPAFVEAMERASKRASADRLAVGVDEREPTLQATRRLDSRPSWAALSTMSLRAILRGPRRPGPQRTRIRRHISRAALCGDSETH